MQQNLVYCLNHPNSLVTHICLGVHLCERKLCSECQYQHQNIFFLHLPLFFKVNFDKFQLPVEGNLIQILKEQLKEKIELFQLNDPIRLNRAKQEFKQAISEMQQTFSSLIDEMNDSSKQIFQEIEKVDRQLFHLLNSNIEESSNSNLYKISEILQFNQLNLWYTEYEKQIVSIPDQKQYCYKIIDENKHHLMKICEFLAIQMRKKIKINHSEKIGFNVFENSQLLGINHDEFICINNEIISKQGNMKLNQRTGLIELLGFSQHENALKTFQIEFQPGRICYIENGKILRIETQNDQSSITEIITNYDQLYKLKWRGEETQTQKKVALWYAYWENKPLELGGLYDKKGMKQGFWIEPCSNYSIQLQVVYAGDYINGKKQGNWKLMKKNSQELVTIGGGYYNEFGEKKGQWTEVYDEILPQQNQLIIDVGKYKGGHKKGCWNNYIFNESFFTKNKLIGGGEYEKGIKNGKWIEIHYSFKQEFQVIFYGLYKNGLKIGKWNIQLKQNNELQLTIGGGNYNKIGQKNGYWIELSNWFHQSHFIIYIGDYKNGKKNGKWNIQYKMKKSNTVEIIGAGEYDDSGLKNGDWIEIFQNYDNDSEITFRGKYIHGLKQGQWDTIYQNYKIGEGNYDKDGEKSGIWTEVHENFSEQRCYVLYVGNYKNGKKIGQWQMLIQSRGELKKQICGSYEQNGLKNGEWIEINYPYQQQFQETVLYQNGIQNNNNELNQDIEL